MKYYVENELRNFEFWAGAVEHASVFTDEQKDELEEIYFSTFEEISEGEVNDTFWFESDYLAQLLGYDNEEDLEERNKEEGLI